MADNNQKPMKCILLEPNQEAKKITTPTDLEYLTLMLL